MAMAQWWAAAACGAGLVASVWAARCWAARRWKRCATDTCLRGKTFLVTGATSGIGLAVARELVRRRARVILAARDPVLARRLVDDIRREQPTGGELIPMPLDLASFESIESFVELVKAGFYKIDVLINNAGVAVPLEKDLKTTEGFEINFGVNHLGHFYLTNLLMDLLKKASPSRVVILSSLLFEKGVINFEDLNMRAAIEDAKKGKRSGHHIPAYCNSKLMNMYFARALADRCKESGVDVYACCPGFTYTNLFRHSIRWFHYIFMAPIGLFFMRSAKQGAHTVVFCATDYSVERTTGKFYRDCAEVIPKYKFDQDVERRLWSLSEEMIKARKPL